MCWCIEQRRLAPQCLIGSEFPTCQAIPFAACWLFEYNARGWSAVFTVQRVQNMFNGPMVPMNKGYAFGFLIVLLVVVLGFYVAYTGFVSSREALRAQPTPVVSTEVAQAPPSPTSPGPTVAATLILVPTPAPVTTSTLTITAPATITQPVAPTSPPAPGPTEPPAAPPAQPTDTPLPVGPPPTPVPIPAHQFRLAGPPTADPNYPICCYIYGTVRDAAGNGLEGVQVQVSNEWNPPAVAATKGGNELGKYDSPINATVVNWEIVLVDPAGNPISTKVQIQFDANTANGYRVDWQRTY